MADIFTATGVKLYIAPSVATTPANAAAYAALTWTEITGVSNIGEVGDEASMVTFAVLGDGRMRKSKGARDAGTLAVVVARWRDDAGQIAIEAAEGTNLNYPFKILLPNKLNATGTDELQYFKGLVASKKINIGSNDTVVTNTYNVAVNSIVVIVEPTAGA